MANAQTDTEISRLYAAAFNRAPDQAGLAYWDNAADAGLTVPQIGLFFAGSPEFIANYGQENDWQFVETLYQNVLGRHGEAQGATYWQGALAGGVSRGNVLNCFAQSPENVARTTAFATPAQLVSPAPAPDPVVAPQQPAAAPAAPIPPAQPADPAQPTPPVAASDPPHDLPAPIFVPDPPAPIVVNETTDAHGGAAYIIATHVASPPATLRISYADAQASSFYFRELGGNLELTDLQFNGVRFVGNSGQGSTPDGAGLAGGTATLTQDGNAVGVIPVQTFAAAFGLPQTGIDSATGHAFLHLG